MNLISCDIPAQDYRVQATLYSALEAIRVAAGCLDAAMEGLPEEPADLNYLELRDFYSARSTCLVFAALLEQMVSGAPSLRDSVFETIAQHKNLHRSLPPGVEAVALALALAQECLTDAMNTSADIVGDDAPVDAAWDVMSAALSAIQTHAGLFRDATNFYFADQAIDAILRGEKIPALPELRKRWLDKPAE